MKLFQKILNNNKAGGRILFHFLFWILYIVFFTAHYGAMYKEPEYIKLGLNMLIHVWVVIASAYFLVYFLLPVYLFKKRYIGFFLLFPVSVLITILLYRAVGFYISYPLIFPELMIGKSFWDIYPLADFITIYSVIGLFGMIKLLKYWFVGQQEKLELEKQNKESELMMLRNQLSPHFLFNTLNNIDTLINKDQKKASEAVIKLSDIMRYMLYESNDGQVLLSQEIKYLESYISLQKLRLTNPDSVSLSISGLYKEKLIAPMLLIPFVENAFKHARKDQDFFIDINIICSESSINIDVKNLSSLKINKFKDKSSGIGLSNVKRRLQLIYPQKHELKITDKNATFHVGLKINY